MERRKRRNLGKSSSQADSTSGAGLFPLAVPQDASNFCAPKRPGKGAHRKRQECGGKQKKVGERAPGRRDDGNSKKNNSCPLARSELRQSPVEYFARGYPPVRGGIEGRGLPWRSCADGFFCARTRHTGPHSVPLSGSRISPAESRNGAVLRIGRDRHAHVAARDGFAEH